MDSLLFPQRQGSGPDNVLYHAALSMARACPEFEFHQVPVLKTCDMSVQNKIMGYDAIREQMSRARDILAEIRPECLLTIGGDCGIEPVPVSFLNQRCQGRLTVVWLDAHGDLNTPDTSPSGQFHGMPLATLLGLGDPELCQTCFSHLRPDQVILAGVRALDPPEQDLIQTLGLTCLSTGRMRADPGALAAAVRAKGNDRAYLHIDMDVLDPGAYPHVKHPEPGGLTPSDLYVQTDKLMATTRAAGMGIMEFLPESRTNQVLGPVKALARRFMRSQPRDLT